MESWMTKFDNNLLTITEFLSRIEPLLPSIHVPPTQKLYVATIGCGDGGGEVHIVEGRAETERSMEGGTMKEKSVDGRLAVEKTIEIKVVKERNVVESLPVEAKPHMIIWASASLWMKIQASRGFTFQVGLEAQKVTRRNLNHYMKKNLRTCQQEVFSVTQST
jgi:hypothetical protein